MSTRLNAPANPPPGVSPQSSPSESVGRHLRWQVLLALAGVLILTTILGYSAVTVKTVLVPAQGGDYREGVAGSPRFINPLRCDVTEVDADLCALLFRGLTRTDRTGRAVPDLAESWTVSADGMTYDFVMKEGQYWDDGAPVTADDVVFTVGILQDPEVYSLPALSSLWQAVQVVKVDDRTVRFTLREPFSPFLDYTSIGLLPRHLFAKTPPVDVATKRNPTPVGNGPMKIVDMAADHFTLKPNPFYGGKAPWLDSLELRFFADHSSLFPAYEAGEIDAISRVLPEVMPAAAAREDLQIFSSAQPSYLNITLNLNNPNAPFFQEKEVRQALLYAIDRERLIEDVAAGQGIIADSPILPENWAFNPDTPHYAFDPERAKALLEAAGWLDTNGDGVREKDGRPLQFQLHTNDDPTRVGLINRIAQDWAAVGVRAVPTPVTFAGLVNDLLAPRAFEAVLIGWETPGDPDPYPLWHSTQTDGAGQNYSGWNNEDADQVMEAARAEPDEAERKALYGQFQQIFAEELPALLLYYPVYSYGVSDKVFNVQIGALNTPSQRFGSFADWYMMTQRVPESQATGLQLPAPPAGSPDATMDESGVLTETAPITP